jgi:hypothetical protein
MLCFFCEAVLNVLEQGEEYLLSGRGYLLLPEWIFWSSFEKRIALCYLPGREEGTKHEFVTLVEYLLEHTDHADKRAVSFIYGLYDLVTTEGVAVERLLQYIHEKRTEEASPNHTESAAKQREDAAVPWPQKESRQPQENISFALEPVLSEIPGRLQREFAKSWGTICCAAQKTELMVGRAQESDIYLPFAAVSRKHAVFFYENGRLYLMDMSSKNGTQLDGEKISASVKIPCRENVIVTFADISYRLVLH